MHTQTARRGLMRLRYPSARHSATRAWRRRGSVTILRRLPNKKSATPVSGGGLGGSVVAPPTVTNEEAAMSKRVEFSSKSGQKEHAEVAEPAGTGKTGGVVLIQEYWGVNDHMRSMTDRLAAE